VPPDTLPALTEQFLCFPLTGVKTMAQCLLRNRDPIYGKDIRIPDVSKDREILQCGTKPRWISIT